MRGVSRSGWRVLPVVVVCLYARALYGGEAETEEAPQPEKPPSFVNWTYEGAEQYDNKARSMITLNSWWRFQKIWPAPKPEQKEGDQKPAQTQPQAPPEAGPPTSNWLYRKVPGFTRTFKILQADGKEASPPTIEGYTKRQLQDKMVAGSCWVEREFSVPPAWKDRDVYLILENVEGDGEIYLDGTLMGRTWPLRPHHVVLPRPYHTDEPYRLTIKSSGVVGDVWLKAFTPSPYRITDSYLMTSVRNMNCTLRASGTGKPDVKVRVIISEYKNEKKVVKEAGPFTVQATAQGWTLEQAFPWTDPKLWSLEQPHLYKYFIELVDDGGKVQDRIFPIRFGFREIWIKGGSFMLNNRRITMTTDIHAALGRAASWNFGRYANEEAVRKIIKRWKDFGVVAAIYRSAANKSDDNLFRIADEEGFFIGIGTPGFRYRNPQFMSIPKIRQHAMDHFKYLILPRRHSPSVAFYHLPNTHHDRPCWDYQPSMLGEDFDKAQFAGKDPIAEEREIVHDLDPARPAYAGSGGGKYEPVHGSMNYMPIDADLQTHETWPSKWYKNPKRPISLDEMDVPSIAANWIRRRSRGDRNGKYPKGSAALYLEIAATHFGESVYLEEDKKKIDAWLTHQETGQRLQKDQDLRHSLPYKLFAHLFVKNVFRSWRTYGINMGFWCMFWNYYEEPRMSIKPTGLDPRRSGPVPDNAIYMHHYTVGPVSELGQVAKAALSPLLAYIGGPDGEFTNKDHTYYTGETVKKAVVILNDSGTPAAVTGTWKLVSAKGATVLKGKIPETRLVPGELAPAKAHIEFKAPRVRERTDYVLHLMAKADKPGTLEDSFAITVFPQPVKPQIPKTMRIVLFDPVGETKALLDKADVKYELVDKSLPRPANSLFIVGRNALKDKANQRRLAGLILVEMTYDFRVNVSNGMRVLVFEQALDNLWGLKTEQSRWRRSFICAPGHPIFDGLAETDFVYLKGDSSLVDPYPGPPDPSLSRIAMDRYPEWGNDNVVTTYSIVRPQKGACRALLDCGFDLQETPLLEVAGGTGRMIFCQMDVTNRYGKDPVSTQLVNNMLTYITNAEPPAGAGKLTDLVREGWEDYDLEVKTERVFMVDKPAGPISWGISQADLYFQGHLDLPVIQTKNGQRVLYTRIEGEKAIAHMLNKRKFKTKWQKMKAMTIRSALLINQGNGSDVYPTPFLQGDDEELYPMEWLEGFVHPYLLMQW